MGIYQLHQDDGMLCELGRMPVSELELRGGTDAAMAPPVGYLQHVLVPVLKSRLGLDVGVQLVRRGFYPKGGGIMRLMIKPLMQVAVLPPLDLTNPGNVSQHSELPVLKECLRISGAMCAFVN